MNISHLLSNSLNFIKKYQVPFFFFLVFNLYLWKVFPDIFWVDSGEFTFHSLFLGIPHPTGYPTYIQLLKLFSLFPFGSPFYWINFSSALFGFFSLILLYKIVFHITEEKFPSLFTVVVFGLSPTFMSKVDTAEVYTLQILILLSVVYLFLSWMATKDKRKIVIVAFLLGLGITNHMTTILLIPAMGIIFFIWNHNHKDTARTLLLSVPFFLLGCLPYLFIFSRNDLPAPINFAKLFGIDFKTIYGWYWLLSGELFRFEMMPASIWNYLKEIGFFGYLLFKDFYYLPTLIGILGLTGQVRYDKKKFLFLFSLFISLTGFFIYYRIPDIHDYYTLSFALFSIWIGIGVHRLMEYFQSSTKLIGGKMVFLALSFFCLIPLSAILTEKESGTKEYALEYAHKMFAVLPENSILFTTYTGGNTLLLMQRLSNIRPDITIFDYGVFSLRERFDLAKRFNPKEDLFINRIHLNFRNKLLPYINQELDKRPVFFSRDEPFLYNLFLRKKMDEGFYEISRKPYPLTVSQIPPTARPVSLNFDHRFSLLGYKFSPSSLMEGEQFFVDFYWQAIQTIPKEIIGLLFFSKEQHRAFANSNNFFVEFSLGSELWPPTKWKPGQMIQDRFQISVNPNLRKGDYFITLALIEKEYFQNTLFKKIKPDFYPIGKIQINENPKLNHYWDE